MWPAPANIIAFSTTDLSVREGTSAGEEGKARLASMLQMEEVFWLEQVHGNTVVTLPHPATKQADAVVTMQVHVPCVIRTADCLPLLFCTTDGSVIGNAHAGWRGLHAGIIEETVKTMDVDPRRLLVWLGPAICQQHYEVGTEMHDAFMQKDPANAIAFRPGTEGKHFADLYTLARLQLYKLGIGQEMIFGGDRCTFKEQILHSHRRDGEQSGRIATVIMKTA